MNTDLDKMSKNIINKGENYLEDLKFLEEIYDYYCKNDLESGKIAYHSKIFKELYLSDKKINYQQIADDFMVDIKTIFRYRQKYSSFAIALKQYHNEKIPISTR